MTQITLSRRDREFSNDAMTARHGWEPQSTVNWRDVGGLRTTTGDVVRHGRLFRSDTLQDLTAEDVEVITGRLGVRTVIDLRLRDEAAAEGSGPLAAHERVRHYNLPLVGSWSHDPGVPLSAGADRCAVGYSISCLEQSAAALTTSISMLTVPRALPAIVHCAAGKDRTGVVIAFVLSMLGVPDAAIATEYAKSTPRIPAILERLSTKPTYAAHPAGLRPEVNRTRPQSMRAVLALVRDRYGSVEAYLRDHGMAADAPEALREALLTAPKLATRWSA